EKFPFITRPKSSAIKSAEETLKFIDAIDQKRKLTSIGEKMVRFPLLPRHARVLVEAMLRFPSVIEEVTIAVAFLSSKTPFLFPPGQEDESRQAHKSFNSEEGDFISYLNLYRHIRALPNSKARELYCKQKFLDYPSMAEIHHIVEQLSEIISDMGFPISSGGTTKDYLCCLAAGLIQYVCIKSGRNIYQSLTADQIFIHPGSAWFKEMPQFLLVGEIVQTSRMYARTVSPLKKEWLDIISPDLRQRLMGLRKSGKKEEKVIQKAVPQKITGDTALIFGRNYKVLKTPKGKRNIVVIPVSDLEFLTHANQKNSRRLKNFPATLEFQGNYIHYGDKFLTLLSLHGKLFPEKGILATPPTGNFTAAEAQPLADNLEWILAFCRLKRKRHLGFVQLVVQSNGTYRFSRTRYYFEALDTSLYALGQLVDEIDKVNNPNALKQTKKVFKELLRSFDS
ncbi:MAG: oligonucleotide/oligosaccharide-binding fold domain-containing protein, partial [Sphaerochaetaceae bacterium]